MIPRPKIISLDSSSSHIINNARPAGFYALYIVTLRFYINLADAMLLSEGEKQEKKHGTKPDDTWRQPHRG
jgi:hypothetical protein